MFYIMVNKNIILKANNVCVMLKQHETVKAVSKSPCSNSNHSDIFNKLDKFSRKTKISLLNSPVRGLEGNWTFKFLFVARVLLAIPFLSLQCRSERIVLDDSTPMEEKKLSPVLT